jgi:hypothetical protein
MDSIIVAACVPNDCVSFGGGEWFLMRVLASVGMVVACPLGNFCIVGLHAAERRHSSVVLWHDSVSNRANGHM